MAKQVQPLEIILGIKGAEKLAALKSSFRDLTKTVKQSDADIESARKSINDYVKSANNSEAVIRGQIKAFEGLREQAAMGGKVYRELSRNIEQLESNLRGSTDAVKKKRERLVELAAQSKNNAAALAKVVTGLQRLKSSVREDSAAYRQLNSDIEKTNKSLTEVNVTAAKARFTINQALAVKPEKIVPQIKRIQAAIASGTLEAQDLARALLDLELLNVGAGRAGAVRKAQAFDDRIGKRYFDSLRKNYEDLAKTSAIISQRISEVNTELANVTGYERRRALTIELINLNKELRSAVVNVRTAEEFQGFAIRQRMGRARETYAASGFGEWSAEIRQRTAGGEFTLGMQKAQERVRLAKQEAQEMKQIADLQKVINGLADEHAESLRSALRTMDEYEQKLGDDIVRKYEEATAAQQKAAREEAAREEKEYQRRIGILRQMRTGEFASRRLIGLPREELSGLYSGIVQIGQADQLRQLEMMGRSYDQVADDIRKVTAASNGSIASLNAQRGSWASLRNILDPSSRGFKEATAEIERLDRALEKIQRRRRRMSSMQMTQAAGAAISGGIFGGPEGFLGGVGGALVGGVGGAFAGAAFGAQLGGLRKQIGQYTEMAAEIQRLRLGLAGASNDFADFVNATQATEQASQRLLIPLADSYRIMTQLRANTVELGISTDDTRKIFEGITASIYKTGGGLAEVQGAMRAVIQVLSKGAPQAEELRGQLGERLPAAIIDFAKFTQRTPEELAKAFEDSKVTLEEFVDFAKNKFDENGEYLDELGDNAAYAGMRYQKALERVQLTTGTAFQAAGANLQDFATFWLNRFDEMINKALELGIVQPGENYFVQQVLDQKITIEELETKILRLAQAYKELKKFSFDVFGIRVGAPAGKRTRQELEAAENALKRLRRLEEQTKERKKQDEQDRKNQEEKQRATSLLNAIEQRENAIAQARIQLEEQAANIRKQAIEQARQLEQRFADQRLQKERELQDLRRQLAYVEEDIALSVAESQFVAAGGDPEIARIRREAVEFERKQKEEEIELERQFLDEQTETSKAIEEFKSSNAKAIMEANEQHTKRMGEIQREYARNVAKIVEEGTGRAGKRLEIAGAIAAAQIKKGMAESRLEDLGVFINEKGEPKLFPGVTLDSGAKKLVSEQTYFYDEASREIQELTEKLSQVSTATAIAAPEIDRISINVDNFTSSLEKNAAALDRQNEKIKKLKEGFTGGTEVQRLVSAAANISTGLAAKRQQLERDQAISRGVLRLREEGYSDGTARNLMEQELGAVQLRAQIQELRKQVESAAGSQEQRAKAAAAFDAIEQSIESSANAVRDLTIALDNIPTEIKLREAIVDLKQQLKDLVDPADQIKGAATAIGDAFATSFVDAISGAKTAKEALADFFQSVGSYFLDMAKQIIAKMIQIAILNTVVKLFPGMAGGSGGGDIFSDIASRGGLRMKNGGIFDKEGVMPFAMGGIVEKPTLFRYASGGAGRFGLMGEAGPEAIMPLKRGRDGKLGVAGGGTTSVTVNVDAQGTRVQGDDNRGQQLGRAVAAAVQQELIKQKRPGGLLA